MKRLPRGTPPTATRTQREGVAYARVSSKEQEEEGFSIPAQKKLLGEYAQQKAIPVAAEHVFVESETAKKAGRPRFDAMIAVLKKAPWKYALLVEKTDRIYRNFRDYVTLDDLVQQGLEIHLIKENVVLSRDSRSSDKFIHGIKVLMAKNFIDNLSEETRKGLTEKAEEGMWPTHAPIGYRNEVHDKRKVMVPDPDMGGAVVRTFEAMATGDHSVEDVTRVAKTNGLVFRKSRAPMPTSSVHHMLRNPLYMGRFWWKGKLYDGIYEPLISRELWERVQAVLDRRFEKRHRKVIHDFAFARLIECGHCGSAMVGELKKNKYIYYHCTGGKARAQGLAKCPEPYTREEVLADKFAELLRGLTFDQDVVDWVAKALRESHEDAKRHQEEAVTRLHAEYVRLEKRIDAAYEDKLDGRIETSVFDVKAAGWRAEQDRVRDDIARHQAAKQTYFEEGILLLELARNAEKLFKAAPAGEKRRLLDLVLSNSSWKGGELTTTFREPFDFIAGTVANDRGVLLTEDVEIGRSEIWLRLQDSNLRPGG